MILNLLNDNSEAQKSEKPNSTRRKFLKGIGTTATIGMAGCTRQRQREVHLWKEGLNLTLKSLKKENNKKTKKLKKRKKNS